MAAAASGGAVLEANFHRSVSRAGIQALPGLIIEVFCRCDREVALARYRERSQHRHPGHFDDRRSDDELWNDEVTTPVAGEWAVPKSTPTTLWTSQWSSRTSRGWSDSHKLTLPVRREGASIVRRSLVE